MDRFRDELGFLSRVGEVAEELRSLIKEGRSFLVLCHNDADGMAAGGICYAALLRENARFTVRSVRGFDEASKHLENLPE